MHDELFQSCLPAESLLATEYKLLRNMCLGRIIRACKESSSVPSDLEKMIAQGFEGISVHPRLIWESYQKPVNLDRINDALQCKEPQLEYIASPYSDWVSWLIDNQNRVVALEANEVDCMGTYARDKSKDEARFGAALDFLKEGTPDYLALIQRFVRKIVLVGGKGFWSSSVPRAHGVVFVNPQESWSNAHYIETLVHESAHLELTIRQMVDPIVLNPSHLVYSSIRRNERPLIGVFHAMFVLVRTCSVLKVLGENAVLSESLEHLHDIRSELDKVIKVTERGALLYADMQRVSQELLA